MHGVILAGFYFNWHHGKAVVVVDEIIHLAFAAIIVIVKGMAVADEDALVLHEQEPLGWLRGAVIAVARDLLKWNVREQLVQLFPVPPAIAEMEYHAGSGLVHGADHIGQIPVGIGEDQNFHSSSSFP